MKIYKFELLTDRDNPGYFLPLNKEIYMSDIDDNVSSNFKWDKVNSFSYPEKNTILFISNDCEKLESFCDGMSEMIQLYEFAMKYRK